MKVSDNYKDLLTKRRNFTFVVPQNEVATFFVSVEAPQRNFFKHTLENPKIQCIS